MICSDPSFVRGHVEYACGQCDECRINRRRLWALRLMLESASTPPAYFVTLTFKENPLEVNPRDLRLFIKRLRHLHDGPVRYYGVGEYGDVTFRPHYHLALFGLRDVSLIERCWPSGFVQVQPMSLERAMYLAGYVVKKLTKQVLVDQVPQLKGKHPEFARMSLRPGIGALAMEKIFEASYQYMRRHGVPAKHLAVGGEQFPLGRYLRSVLADLHGLPEDFGKNGAYIDSVAFALSFPTPAAQDEFRAGRKHQRSKNRRRSQFYAAQPKRKKGVV